MSCIQVGSKKNGYFVDGDNKVLTIYPLSSLYEKLKNKNGNIELPFIEIEKVEVTHNIQENTIIGRKCGIVLIACSNSGSKVPFHGMIEASKDELLDAIYLMRDNGLVIVDEHDLVSKMSNSSHERVDYVILDYLKDCK